MLAGKRKSIHVGNQHVHRVGPLRHCKAAGRLVVASHPLPNASLSFKKFFKEVLSTPLPSPAGSIFINILQVFLYFRGDICLCKKLHEVGFHGAIDTSDF